MGNKVDKALNDLMTVEHIMSNAQCILAEYINDLQDRTEGLEAENQRLRNRAETAEDDLHVSETILSEAVANNHRLRRRMDSIEERLDKLLDEVQQLAIPPNPQTPTGE